MLLERSNIIYGTEEFLPRPPIEHFAFYSTIAHTPSLYLTLSLSPPPTSLPFYLPTSLSPSTPPSLPLSGIYLFNTHSVSHCTCASVSYSLIAEHMTNKKYSRFCDARIRGAKRNQRRGSGAYFFIDSVSRAKTVGMSAASILRIGNTGLSGSFN